MDYADTLNEEGKRELLHNMLKVSMSIPIEKVDERLLNAWNKVFEIIKK